MRTEFSQWLNENSSRNYPFLANQTLRDAGNTVEIPQNFLVDLSATGRVDLPMRLASLQVTGSDVVLRFKFGTESTLAVVTIPLASSLPFRSNTRHTIGTWTAFIQLVLGNGLAGVAAFPVATYTFTDLQIEPGAVLVDRKQGVNQITDILTPGVPVAGAVKIIPGINVDVTFDAVTNTIFITAGVGAGTGPGPAPGDFGNCDGLIFDVGGVTPDDRGNINILGAGNIEVSNTATDVNIDLQIGNKICA